MPNIHQANNLKCRFGCSGLFPVSEGHKLIQNFLQSLEPPFLVGGCLHLSCAYACGSLLISAISSRSFLIRSDTNFGINTMNCRERKEHKNESLHSFSLCCFV